MGRLANSISEEEITIKDNIDIGLALVVGSFIAAISSSGLLYFIIPTTQGHERLDALIKWNGILMFAGLIFFAISALLKKNFMMIGHGVTGIGAGLIICAPDIVMLCDISKNDKSFSKKSAEFEMYNTVIIGSFFAVIHFVNYFTGEIGISIRIGMYMTLGLVLGTYSYTMHAWANDKDWIFEEGVENSIYSESFALSLSDGINLNEHYSLYESISESTSSY